MRMDKGFLRGVLRQVIVAENRGGIRDGDVLECVNELREGRGVAGSSGENKLGYVVCAICHSEEHGPAASPCNALGERRPRDGPTWRPLRCGRAGVIPKEVGAHRLVMYIT